MAGNPILFSDPLGDTPGTGDNNSGAYRNDLVPPEGGGGSPQTNPQALSAGTTNNTKKTEKKADNNSTLISGWWGERSSEKSLEITHSDPQSLSLYVENKVISELPYSESDKSIVSDATSFQVNDFYFPKDLC
jgi:hypothetical protein